MPSCQYMFCSTQEWRQINILKFPVPSFVYKGFQAWYIRNRFSLDVPLIFSVWRDMEFLWDCLSPELISTLYSSPRWSFKPLLEHFLYRTQMLDVNCYFTSFGLQKFFWWKNKEIHSLITEWELTRKNDKKSTRRAANFRENNIVLPKI